jgi:hypothetical protein
VTERQILRDTVSIRGVNHHGTAQHPTPLRVLGGEQVALASVGARDLAGGRYLKPLRNGFPGLNTFWTTHIQLLSLEKERAI